MPRFPGRLHPVAILLLVACARVDDRTSLPEWRLEAAPVLSIGDRAESDSMLLARVSDARFLTNGGIAIADAGANRILFYDAAGKAGPRAGRRGRGPGEFVGQLTLVEATGDSVAVWDPSQIRWTLVDSRTGGLRAATDSIRAPTILHAGLMVQSDLVAPPSWVPRLLSALAADTIDVRVGHLDEGGLLWISMDAALREWRVFADSGEAVARLTLPMNVRALHFQHGAMIGIASDSTGLEQVVVHRIAMAAAPTVDRTPATRPAVDNDARRALQSSMRNAVVAQEANYAMRNSYTAFTDSLPMAMPPGARFKVLSASNRGWSGVGWYEATGYTCAMLIGLPVPAGWMEGAPRCGW